MIFKLKFITIFLLAFQPFFAVQKNFHGTESSIQIPLGGNTWANKEDGEKCITNEGIQNWSDKSVEFKTYLRINQTGSLHLKLKGRCKGKCQLLVTIKDVSKKLNIQSEDFQTYDVGEWNLHDTGYIAIQLKGLEKTSDCFADIQEYEVSGSAINASTAFVKNNDGNFFYWGRRGPSVHLKYVLPENAKAKWFYNEVTVPKGEDVIGSYFMACSFGEGYFGMQVNSATERRILFSVWSPFSTNDPKKIPVDERIRLLKKGNDVHAGEFGDEGSGGQSFLRYNWKAGNTYKFLISATPDNQNNTTYTAYFFAPEKNEWMLIASFVRPKTNTYLKGLHSFLENFIPQQGDKTRKVLFGNQWVQNIDGNWIELTKAIFTYDNTAAKGYRMDYQGGVVKNCFYLKNCGFFNNYTPYKTIFERKAEGKIPQIDFSKLP